MLQGRIPACLQLPRDEPLGRIDAGIAPLGQQGLVLRFLELTLAHLADLGVDLGGAFAGTDRRFDGVFGDGLQQLADDRAVDANATNANAQAGAVLIMIAAALVAMGVTGASAIVHAHHAPTAATAGQPRQQGAPAPGGLA